MKSLLLRLILISGIIIIISSLLDNNDILFQISFADSKSDEGRYYGQVKVSEGDLRYNLQYNPGGKGLLIIETTLVVLAFCGVPLLHDYMMGRFK